MRKLILLALLLGPLFPTFAADVVGPGPAPVILPSPDPAGIYYHIGPVNFTVPWNEINAVYLYDLVGKRNLVGGEAVVLTLWKFQGTVGAVTSIDGKGAPYAGGNIWLPNPIQQIQFLNYVKPGIFGGYDWNRGSAILGLKAAIPIF